MAQKNTDPVLKVATSAVERTLARRKTNVFDDYHGTMRAVVRSASRAAAAEATKGMVALDDVEDVLREHPLLLEDDEVGGLMRALYYLAGAEVPERLRAGDDE